MLYEFLQYLADWRSFDTQIVVTGALAAMSCALPGAWLFLRKQSLLGDALSHSVLPGIVLAYLALHAGEQANWISHDSKIRHLILFIGATISGVLSALLTEFIQRWGQTDRGAAIGVVFTSMFAFGLLLIRMFADQADIDPSCVLYGSLETSAGLSGAAIPSAAVMNGILLAINGLLTIVFFKELRLSTFDPSLAESMGIRANWIQVGLMAMTAGTLVAAFESVGAILVIAMLIVPAATARLLTDRLEPMLWLTVFLAAVSAVLGHASALTLPPMLFSRLGHPEIEDASTTGMMAVASGGLFVAACFLGPRHGLFRRLFDQFHLNLRIAGEDFLGQLYRRDEKLPATESRADVESNQVTLPHSWLTWLAKLQLARLGLIEATSGSPRLTDNGFQLAQNLIRSHRLWETYMARHFTLPDDHLHSTAEQVEHFLSPQLQTELAAELDQPHLDPHGQAIPQTQPPPARP